MLLQMSVIIKFSLPHIVGSLYPEKYCRPTRNALCHQGVPPVEAPWRRHWEEVCSTTSVVAAVML